MRPLNNIPQFVSPNCFDALRMKIDDNDKESDKQLIQNETDSHPLKSIILETKTRALTGYPWRFHYKKHLWQCYHKINKA